MDQHSSINEWKRKIEKELDELQFKIEMKVDRTIADQITRQQEELIHKYKTLHNTSQITEIDTTYYDPERVCMECVEAGDLNTAFMTILRYIDSISSTKAERCDVHTKSTQSYANSLFDRLCALSHIQIEETTNQLEQKIQEQISGLSNDFINMKNTINQRIAKAQDELDQISDSVSKYCYSAKSARNMNDRKKPITSLAPVPKQTKPTELTPRRITLKKASDQSLRQIRDSQKLAQAHQPDFTLSYRVTSSMK